MGYNRDVLRRAVREAEERVATAYADLAVEEQLLARWVWSERRNMRRGGEGWPSRAAWAHFRIAAAERRVVLARHRLAEALTELNVLCGRRRA